MPNYRFVSSGQNVEDALTVTQTLLGNSLKPLAPVNIRGTRNAAGDLLIEWTRRSRIAGGLRPKTGVPLAEERALYEIEIYSGSTLKSTWRVGPDYATPILWRTIENTNSTTISADGTLTQGFAGSEVFGRFVSIQAITGTAIFEYTVDVSGDYEVPMTTSMAATASGGLPSDSYSGGWIYDGTAQAKASNSVSVAVATGDRIRTELLDDAIYRYFRNRTSPESPSLLTNAAANRGNPSYVYADMSYGAGVPAKICRLVSPVLRRLDQPDFVYTTAMQVSDFGSTQSAIKVRLFQVSAVVGRGDFIEATI